jgi:hypothetical protein
MKEAPNTYCHLAFLLFFLLTTLFINYFHTEKCLYANNACPACHFQNSTLATNQINFFLLPQLCLLEILKTFEIFEYGYLLCVEPNSRAPPQA